MLSLEEGSLVAAVSLTDDAEPHTPHAVAWSVVDRSVFLSSFFIRPF